jgi:hypothetical protein
LLQLLLKGSGIFCLSLVDGLEQLLIFIKVFLDLIEDAADDLLRWFTICLVAILGVFQVSGVICDYVVERFDKLSQEDLIQLQVLHRYISTSSSSCTFV